MFDPINDLEKIKINPNKGLAGMLGIEILEVQKNSITAKMPVDSRTHQPFGILHGGASVVLAETLGSIASWLVIKNQPEKKAVGLEVNANHVRSISEGYVYAKAEPLKIGKTIHVWDIKITDIDQNLICISRLTVMII